MTIREQSPDPHINFFCNSIIETSTQKSDRVLPAILCRNNQQELVLFFSFKKMVWLSCLPELIPRTTVFFKDFFFLFMYLLSLYFIYIQIPPLCLVTVRARHMQGCTVIHAKLEGSRPSTHPKQWNRTLPKLPLPPHTQPKENVNEIVNNVYGEKCGILSSSLSRRCFWIL